MDIGSRAFEAEVADLAGRDYAPGVLEVRGDTPTALLSIGVPDLPMHHTRAHAAMEMAATDGPLRGHGVAPSTLADLPRLLEDPVAVIESNSRPGVLMVVLDSVAGPYDEPLTAMVDPDVPLGPGGRDGTRTNFILSAYGRAQVVREVAEAVAGGTALLYDGPRFWSLACRCTRPDVDAGNPARATERAPGRGEQLGRDGHEWVEMGRAHRPGRR